MADRARAVDLPHRGASDGTAGTGGPLPKRARKQPPNQVWLNAIMSSSRGPVDAPSPRAQGTEAWAAPVDAVSLQPRNGLYKDQLLLDEKRLEETMMAALETVISAKQSTIIARGTCHLCGSSDGSKESQVVVNFCSQFDVAHSLCREHLQSMHKVRWDQLNTCRRTLQDQRQVLLKCAVCTYCCPCASCHEAKTKEIQGYRQWLQSTLEKASTKPREGKKRIREKGGSRSLSVLERDGQIDGPLANQTLSDLASAEKKRKRNVEGEELKDSRHSVVVSKQKVGPNDDESIDVPVGLSELQSEPKGSSAGRAPKKAAKALRPPSNGACAEPETSANLNNLPPSTKPSDFPINQVIDHDHVKVARDLIALEISQSVEMTARSSREERNSRMGFDESHMSSSNSNRFPVDESDNGNSSAESANGIQQSSRKGKRKNEFQALLESSTLDFYVETRNERGHGNNETSDRGDDTIDRMEARSRAEASIYKRKAPPPVNVDKRNGRAGSSPSPRTKPGSKTKSVDVKVRKKESSSIRQSPASSGRRRKDGISSTGKEKKKRREKPTTRRRGRPRKYPPLDEELEDTLTKDDHDSELTGEGDDGDESELDTNLDYCEICSRAGDLVCCDVCPRSFHLRCLKIKEEDLPEGEWQCKECKRPSPFDFYMAAISDKNTTFTKCQQIVRCLKVHPFARPFLDPVTDVPNYSSIVKHPMDLRTIERKLKQDTYFSNQSTTAASGSEERTFDLKSFARDVRLIWSNCKLFNDDGSGIVRAADELSRGFERLLSHVVELRRQDNFKSSDFDAEGSIMSTVLATETKPTPVECSSASTIVSTSVATSEVAAAETLSGSEEVSLEDKGQPLPSTTQESTPVSVPEGNSKLNQSDIGQVKTSTDDKQSDVTPLP